MRTSTLLLTAALFAIAQAAGADFSLQTISPIKKSEVSEDCYEAYTKLIPSCTASCTTSCITALTAAAVDIRDECADAFTGMDTLLRRINDGGIVAAVCPESATAIVLDSSSTSAAASLATAVTGLVLDMGPTPTPTATASFTGLMGAKSSGVRGGLFAAASTSGSTSPSASNVADPNSAAGEVRVWGGAVVAVAAMAAACLV